MTFKPVSAVFAFEMATLDRFTRQTEDIAVTFTDTDFESSTYGRALRHYSPAQSYARAASRI